MPKFLEDTYKQVALRNDYKKIIKPVPSYGNIYTRNGVLITTKKGQK